MRKLIARAEPLTVWGLGILLFNMVIGQLFPNFTLIFLKKKELALWEANFFSPGNVDGPPISGQAIAVFGQRIPEFVVQLLNWSIQTQMLF